jgi:peptidylprolyl isomerase
MLTAETGDTVKVSYVGKLADGTIFDTSAGKPPLHFILGKQEVIPGFDQATCGMVQGEKKAVTISCDDAYGPYHEKLVETIDITRLPDDLELTLGGQLEVSREDGQKMYFLIKELTETTVTLDANHPLAGKQLSFEIELLEVKKTSAAK